MSERPLLLLHRGRHNRNSLAALAGALEADGVGAGPAGLEVSEVDTRGLAAALTEAGGRPVLYGASFMTIVRAEAGASLAQVRAALGGRLLAAIAGGPDPSGAPGASLDLGFDVVLRGEGEVAFPALVRRLLAGDPLAALEEIPGVVTPAGGPRETRAEAADLEALPPFPSTYREATAIELIRGCSGGCRFCQTGSLSGHRERWRSPERVARWAAHLAAHDHPFIRFVAPNSLAYGGGRPGAPNLDAIAALLDAVNGVVASRGAGVYFGSFPSEVRPEYVTPEVLALMRRHALNRRLSIGIQSASEAVLARCGRRHDARCGRRAVVLALAAGFEPVADFIFGLPGESEEEARASLALTEELLALGARVNAHAFMPFPGTEFAAEVAVPLPRWLLSRFAELTTTGRFMGRWSMHAEFETRRDSGDPAAWARRG